MDRCPDCGLDRTLVGYRHRCVSKSRGADKALNRRPKPSGELASPKASAVVVVASSESDGVPREQFDRKTYQREYMRDYMRRKRAGGGLKTNVPNSA